MYLAKYMFTHQHKNQS